MKIFRGPGVMKKERDGEISFRLEYYSEHDIFRYVDVYFYEGGKPIGKMIATEIKNDRLESGLHLKSSYFNESYFFHGFLSEIGFVFEDGPRLRVNSQFRKYDKNILMVSGVFMYEGERYLGEGRDMYNIFSDRNQEYIYFFKEEV
ncbi:hypothetical protein NG726_27625 [Pseudomonas sp. MOB-449]|nr:hypothetical protein [Pseudomonas sp. MOB-449]